MSQLTRSASITVAVLAGAPKDAEDLLGAIRAFWDKVHRRAT